MITDGLGDRVPRRAGDEVRKLFDGFAHPELLALLERAAQAGAARGPDWMASATRF
jgi:hypothetical protein